MRQKLTFKEYFESKRQLRDAIETTPRQTFTYTVRKYCKLALGDAKQEKTQIVLKPGHIIIVEWLYLTLEAPTVQTVRFDGVGTDIDNITYTNTWPVGKLQKWLDVNTYQPRISLK